MTKSLNLSISKLFAAASCFFLTFFTLQASAQTGSQQGYVITGSIKGINSGKVFIFSNVTNKATDSAVIADGQFVMKGKTSFPQAQGFRIMPGNWSFRAFIENTLLNIAIDTIDAQHQYDGKIDYPMWWQIKETGSEMADVYTQYQNETEQTYGLSLLKKSKMTTDTAERALIKSKVDTVLANMPAKQKAWIENYVHQNPSSIGGAFIFDELFDQALSSHPPAYLQSILDQFSGAAKTSIYYKEIVTKINNLKNKEVNAIAPDFTLLKRDKSKFTLSSTRGKFIMLDFWASWCVPCRAGIPHWKEVYAKYHPKGFDIVSVSDDRNEKDWIPALNKEQMPWMQVIDEFPVKGSPARVISLYGVPSMPYFVLLDKEGKVLLASGDEELMTKKIAEVIQ